MALARGVVSVGGATLLSRALGFLRDVLIAAVLGAGALADAFFVAVQVPNLFRRLLAEGALNSAFVPLWLRRRQEGGDRGARRFSEDVLGTLGAVLAALAVLCALAAPGIARLLAPGFDGDPYLLATYFLRLSAPYLAVVGLVAVAAATLNAAGRVGAAACSPLAFNAAMIAAVGAIVAFGVGDSLAAGAVLAGAIVVAGLLQLVVVGGALLRLPEPPVAPQLSASADVRRFFAMMLPGIVAAGIPQFTLIAGTMVASASPSAVSWLTYAYRLYELPLGVVSVAIASVVMPAIAAAVRADDRAAAATAQSHALQIVLGLSLPAAVGFALLAQTIVGGLFERGAFGARDTSAVAAALAAIAFGLPGHALEKVLGAVSFAHEDTRTPMLTGVVGLAIAAVGAVDLFPAYGHAGVAAAVASAGWVSALLLAAVLTRRRWLSWDRDLGWRLARIALATAVMGGALAGLQALAAVVPQAGGSQAMRILVMAALVASGLVVYLAGLHWFGIVRLAQLRSAVLRR
jgi:putative peptidoglycan lipid II flippase